MGNDNALDILMIGHLAKDHLVVDGKGEIASGGAVYYGSLVLRRLGIAVGVVTRLHRTDFALLEELRREGVVVFAQEAEETSGIENIYHSHDMERRICRLLGFAGAFRIEDIPDVEVRIYAVTPIIAGEVDLPLLGDLAARGTVALDVQGFVRVPDEEELAFKPWAEIEEGLRAVTYLKVDRAEAELLTGEKDLAVAASKLAGYGPREVVATQAAGVTVFAEGEVYRAPFTPRSLVGRTGRGDTCFASYLGFRLRYPPAEATRLAAAITTLKQEAPGPWQGTEAQARRLLETW